MSTVLLLGELGKRFGKRHHFDVRSPAEFASGNAPGSINIPLNELPSRLVELPKDRDVVVFCASGSRSSMAKMVLKTKGFQKVHNAGTWGNVC